MSDPYYLFNGTRHEYDPVNPVPPERTEVIEGTPRVVNEFGDTRVEGPPAQPDTFFGPRNKKYLDFLCRQTLNIRGTYCVYYVLRSQTQRIDGDQPLSDPKNTDEYSQSGRAGGHTQDEQARGIAALYGEPVVLGPRVNSTRRAVAPTWEYAEPILVKAILQQPTREEQPDERGSVYIKGLRAGLARILCEEEYGIVPQIGDIIRVPDLLNEYYDVEEVIRNESRFGSTGFFTEFGLTLVRNSKHVPERKLPEIFKRDQPDPVV